MSHKSITADDILTGCPNIAADPLRAIDWVILQNRQKQFTPSAEEQLKKVVLQSLLALVGITDFEGEIETEARSVIEHHGKYAEMKTVAICCLRLLPEPQMAWLSEMPWRPRIMSLFDAYFVDDIYRDSKINKDAQAHEKFSPLCEFLRKQEAALGKALDELTSLDRLNAHRNKLMSELNRKTSKALFSPFLPVNAEAQLNELYRLVESYLQHRDDLGIVDARTRLIAEAQQFIPSVKSRGTIYSEWLAERVGQQLITLADEDFRSNKAAQPANVLIEARDKKYPFHNASARINLSLVARNVGSGYAHEANLTVIVTEGEEQLKLLTDSVPVGRLAPTVSQNIEIAAEVLRPLQCASLAAELEWRDFDGSVRRAVHYFTVEAQRGDINWDKLKHQDPYSLEPVTSEQELVGREDSLNRLIGILTAHNTGSAIIHGQKRVGKTSIAKALQSHLSKSGCLVIYLEGGNYVMPTAVGTVTRLGERLCKAISRAEPRVQQLKLPVFDNALSPLDEFLEDVTMIVPDRRIVIILDEFDELPIDLYARGPVGDAFFLTLRSITSRQQIGFVLVGGEKMSYIIDYQGDQLNKWPSLRVDYFSRETDWADYKALIQRPVVNTLDYTEDALLALHECTAGNPYFTKLICRYLFSQALERRDCYITRSEVDLAIEATIRETEKNAFQHFWEDGIVGSGEETTVKSIQRRKVLIALSDVLKQQTPAPCVDIEKHPLVKDLATVGNELREFAVRKVLVAALQGNAYEFKVMLFQRWLISRGVQDVIASFTDLDNALKIRQQEEQRKVQSGEIVDLVKQWGVYRGQSISEDRVRHWLEQFGDIKKQRAMFTILRGIRFYSNDVIRKKMQEVDGIVKREATVYLDRGKLKRSNVLISYLDGPAKSGSQFARLYADEASIYVDSIVERGKLAETLRLREEIQALVFIDDFVGTGISVAEYLQTLDKEISEIVKARDIKVIFVAVVAFIRGWRHVKEAVAQLQMSVKPHACELLDETAQYFSENSSVFKDPDERQFAKETAFNAGKLLEKECPLGYGDLEVGVVFEHRCPNNSLPILWSESTNPKWTPLFRRN